MSNEGIVLKAKALNEGAFHGAIGKLIACTAYPTFGTTFMISKLCRQIQKDTHALNVQYRASFSDLIDEFGSPKVGKEAEYAEKIKDFMETEVIISSEAGQFKKIPLNSLSKVGLSPSELIILDPIIDSTSAPLEVL